MEAPDLSALTTDFVTFGGQLFRKNVNSWDASAQGILVMSGINKPTALAKLSASGNPRPYSADDNKTTGAVITDRILTVHQSKWDFDVDPEKFRNTYLASKEEVPFYQYIIDQVSKEYLAQINDSTAWLGIYNASGSAAVDIATGWKSLLKAGVIASEVTSVTTGTISASNAVAKIAAICAEVPAWMRKRGFRVKCSYDVFDFYATNYAATFGFQFTPDATNRYRINNYNAFLEPETWLDGEPNSVVAVADNNLVLGTDGDSIQVHASMRRNIIELRLMMPVGFQYQDAAAVVVNDEVSA